MVYGSIREAAGDIRSGLSTPTEMVVEALERIDEVDGEIHAFVTVLRELAMEEAEQAERELRTGLARSALHGIPIGIKDLIAVKDVRTTAGSEVLADYVSLEDAAVVEQLRKAGAIVLGKTQLHEFAYGTFTPQVRNPWEHEHIAGGSSGGSAAAVVAGMCLGAIGTDTGGSVRIPAACCGITGLKPTYGRVSCYGVIPLSWSLDHVGPMGRSAEDCALMFDAIAGYDPRDPNSVSGPASRAAAGLLEGPEGRGPVSLQGLKLGVMSDAFVGPLDGAVRQAWQAAEFVLKEAGVATLEVDAPRPTMEMYRTIQRPEASLAHMQAGWLSSRLEAYGESTREHLLQGQKIAAVDYLLAQHERRIFASAMRGLLQRVDALLLPTLPAPALGREQMGRDISVDGVTMNAGTALLSLTMPFNLAGLPALSFPGGFTEDGLPIGLQVVGKAFEEATVLRIAHAFQQLTDWHRRELPVRG